MSAKFGIQFFSRSENSFVFLFDRNVVAVHKLIVCNTQEEAEKAKIEANGYFGPGYAPNEYQWRVTPFTQERCKHYKKLGNRP